MFQDIWEELRREGRNTSRYPYDKVLSFVFRYSHKLGKDRSQMNILEVGCGAGNNLWALALEGFRVWGIDGSQTAIASAEELFKRFGISGKLVVGDFTSNLPFENESFDMVIDRASITCVPFELANKVVKEINRVMKSGGFFFFNPYSQEHYTFKSNPESESSNFVETLEGTIRGTGKVCFYNRAMVEELLSDFEIIELRHVLMEDLKNPQKRHAEFEVICQKR